MHPAAAVQLVLVSVTVQVGNILPIIQVKHIFHGGFFGNSTSLPIKGCSSDVLKYVLCPPEGERAVAVKKKNQQKNLMHSFSRAVIAHLPFQCHALSWLKLKAQIGAALKTFLRNIFH